MCPEREAGEQGAAAGRSARPPWREFRAALAAEGFRPSKGLGQNFLLDTNAARAIALDSGVGRGERVLEVGAGCGFLSVHLAELGVELLALEIDPRLARIAARFLAPNPNVRLLVCDALAGKHALSARLRSELPASDPWHLVSNLPYSISAPLLVLLSRLPNPPLTMCVLVQEEVARRIVAAPGDPEWGALSARLGARYRAWPGRRVEAQLFWPRPRVGSRVAHLEQDPLPELVAEDLGPYDRLLDGLFQQRRKQLSTVLTALVGDRETARKSLQEAGVDPRRRPQELTPAEVLLLSRTPGWRGASGHPTGE